MKNYKMELGKMFASNKLTKEEFIISIGLLNQREKATDPRLKGYLTRQLNRILENKEKVNFKHLEHYANL
jgi:ribosomal protein S17E